MLSFRNSTGKAKTFSLPEPVNSELVEIPVVIVGSEVVLDTPDLKKLKPETLTAMAVAMGGTVGYLKVRAHYELLSNQHCTYQGCWRPAELSKHRCDSHPLVGTK